MNVSSLIALRSDNDPTKYQIPNSFRCATKFSLFFLMKMQLYCEQMVTNDSSKVLPIDS